MRTQRQRVGAALIGPLLVTTACSSISSTDDQPETARVLLEGNAPVPLEVVASTNFTRFFDEFGEAVVELHEADTVEASPPLDRSWQMTGASVGFYIQVRNPDNEVADIRLRVFIDGDKRYDQTAEMSDASLAWVFVAGT